VFLTVKDSDGSKISVVNEIAQHGWIELVRPLLKRHEEVDERPVAASVDGVKNDILAINSLNRAARNTHRNCDNTLFTEQYSHRRRQ